MGKYIAASNTKILENSHFDTVVVHRNVKLGRTRREERTHKADLVHLYREKKRPLDSNYNQPLDDERPESGFAQVES